MPTKEQHEHIVRAPMHVELAQVAKHPFQVLIPKQLVSERQQVAQKLPGDTYVREHDQDLIFRDNETQHLSIMPS